MSAGQGADRVSWLLRDFRGRFFGALPVFPAVPCAFGGDIYFRGSATPFAA